MTGTVLLEAATARRTSRRWWWHKSITRDTTSNGITIYLDGIIQGLRQRVLAIELFVAAESGADRVKLGEDLGLEVTSTHTRIHMNHQRRVPIGYVP